MKNLILFLLNLRFYVLRNHTYISIIDIVNSLSKSLFYGFSRRRFFYFALYILMLLGGFQVSFSQTANFSYTGSNQTFTVPAGVTSLAVTLNGGQGGNSGGPCCVGIGGLGGRTTATIAVTPGQVFDIIVAGQGAKPTTLTGGAGGFGGGGKGGNSAGTGNNVEQTAGGGGGRSAIRLSGGTVDLVTAAGGGGGSVDQYHGAIGGGLSGSAASNQVGSTGGGGGTQLAGGSAGTNGQGYNGTAGTQYQGGIGGTQTQSGGGGGGGYFGGGGGAAECNCTNGSNNQNSGGGGGSSYYGGAGVTGGATTPGVNSGNGSVTISYVAVVCSAGTIAPTLSATTKSNVCPATTADISSLVTSSCPVGSTLEWHTVSTGLSAANKVANPASVLAGTYYPVCFDATNTCYSPTPTSGVTVTITACCQSGTTAPAITATTVTNSCPTTTFSLAALANTGTKPAGTTLIWSTNKVPISANDTLTNLTTVATAGKYYALYYDKVSTCYSPADSVTATLTICTINPAGQSATTNQAKTGDAGTELTPMGGTSPYSYSVDNSGTCTPVVGATALPTSSSLTVTNAATGAYSYTAPATAGTYYYCIKVCDSATPTASCVTNTYTLSVVSPSCAVGTVLPGIK